MIVMLNRATKDTFSCLKILFQVSRYQKKEYMEMTEKFYREIWKGVLHQFFKNLEFVSDDSISHY